MLEFLIPPPGRRTRPGAESENGMARPGKTTTTSLGTPARLGLYGAGLVVVFGASFAIASAVAPASLAENWETPNHAPVSTPAPSHAPAAH